MKQHAWQFVVSIGQGSMLCSLFYLQGEAACLVVLFYLQGEAACLAVCSVYKVRQHYILLAYLVNMLGIFGVCFYKIGHHT